MSVSELKEINGIRGNGIQAGRPILLAKSGSAPVTPNYNTPIAEPTILVAQTGSPTPQSTNTITPRQETVVLASNTVKPQAPAVVEKNDIIIKANNSTPDPLTQLAAQQKNKNENSSIQVATATQTAPVNTATNTAVDIKPEPVLTNNTVAIQETEDQLQTMLAQKEADERINKQLNEWKRESEVVAKPVVVAEATPKGNATYKVQSGDTLYRVAKNHNMNVEDLKRLNKMSADTLVAGTVLQVSGKAITTAAVSKSTGKESMYTVQKGDSWYTISKRVGISHQELIKMNPKNASGLQPGQKIRVRLIDL